MFNIPNHIEILIAKYFSGETVPEEVTVLENWVNASNENREIFKQFAKTNSLAIHTLVNESSISEQRNHISEKKTKFNYWIAASFVALFTLGGFLFYQYFNQGKDAENYLTIQLGTNDRQIIKTFEDQKISDEDGKLIADFRSGILHFVERNGNSDVNIYVPAGKSVDILLPDNTSVKVNSASHFSFKEDFTQQQNRDVTLNGEAFFSVAKDKAHPFYVQTPRFTTRVLGTQFNVNSYLKDEKNSVVLVEGSILVSDNINRDQTILKPGEALNFSKKIKEVEKVEKANNKIQLAWLRNEIYFDNEPCTRFCIKWSVPSTSRSSTKNPAINDDLFTGHFKNENLKQILETLKIAFDCDYQINGDTVTLLPQNKP